MTAGALTTDVPWAKPLTEPPCASCPPTPRDNPDFADVYEQHVDRLYRYVLHCCSDPALAEDLVAETFRRALEYWPHFEWRGVPVAAWLYRIAGNVLAAHYRHAPTVPLDPAVQAMIAAGGAGPEQSVLRAERRREVRAAVAALPVAQRQAILLRYGEELPLRQIAVVLGRSEGATKQCLHRALVALQRTLV